MSVIYRWIIAVAGAMALTAGLFAAMPNLIRVGDPTPGVVLGWRLDERAAIDAEYRRLHAANFGSIWLCLCIPFDEPEWLTTPPASPAPLFSWIRGPENSDDSSLPDELPVEPDRDEFYRHMAGAALTPQQDDVSIYPASLPGRDVRPYMHSPCFHSPQYPESALEVGLEGDVTVQFDVTSVGEITNIQIVESTHPVFAAIVVRCMEAAHYVDAEAMQNVRKGFQFRLD